jgi:hypothetical protein
MAWEYRIVTVPAGGAHADGVINAAAEEGFEVDALSSAADGAGQIHVSVLMRRRKGLASQAAEGVDTPEETVAKP